MGKIRLIFGTYNSLPIVIDESLYEKTYQMAYKPFLKELNNFSGVAVTLYYSGFLLKWLATKHPEFIMLLKDMQKRKQVDIIGGCYYEPFLPLIPHSDRLGQIEGLTTLMRELFGKKPRGGWIPESL